MGLAARTITNFWNVWKAFQPSRETRRWSYNCSADQELLGDERGPVGRHRAGGGLGTEAFSPGTASPPPGEEETSRGGKFPGEV